MAFILIYKFGGQLGFVWNLKNTLASNFEIQIQLETHRCIIIIRIEKPMDIESPSSMGYLTCGADHCFNKRIMVCLKPSCISKCLICPMCAQYEHNGPLHLVQHLDEFKQETLKILSCNSQNPDLEFLASLKSTKTNLLERIKQLQNIMSSLVKKLKYAVNNQFQTFIQSFNPDTQKREYTNFSENLTDVKVINAVYRIQLLKRNEFAGKAQNVKAIQEKYNSIFDNFMLDFLKSTCMFEKLQFVADLRFSDNALSKKIAELKIFEKLSAEAQPQEPPKLKFEQKIRRTPPSGKKNAIQIESSPQSKESNASRSREKRKQQKVNESSQNFPKPANQQHKSDALRRKEGDSIRADSKNLLSAWKKINMNHQIKPLSPQEKKAAEILFNQSKKIIKSLNDPEKTAQMVSKQAQKEPQKVPDKPSVTIQFCNKPNLNRNNEEGKKYQQKKNDFGKQQENNPSKSSNINGPSQKIDQKRQDYFPMKIKTPIQSSKTIQKPNIQLKFTKNINEEPQKKQTVEPPKKVNTQTAQKVSLLPSRKVNNQPTSQLKKKVEPQKKLDDPNKSLPQASTSSIVKQKPKDPRPPKGGSSNKQTLPPPVSPPPPAPSPSPVLENCYRLKGILRPFKKPTSMTEAQLKTWFYKVYKTNVTLSLILSHRTTGKLTQFFWYFNGEFKWQTEQELIWIDQSPAIKDYWQSMKILYK